MLRLGSLFLPVAILFSAILIAILSLSTVRFSKTETATTTPELTPIENPTVTFGNPVRGQNNAPVTIVVFSDYLCTACAAIEKSFQNILKDSSTNVRIVWKDFPNVTKNQEAPNAAVAARCAGLQGAFWEYHDLLFANQSAISSENYTTFAKQLNLDTGAFATCVEKKTTKPLVEKDFEEGYRLQIDGTPFLFINNQRVSGAVPYEDLKTLVQSALATKK